MLAQKPCRALDTYKKAVKFQMSDSNVSGTTTMDETFGPEQFQKVTAQIRQGKSASEAGTYNQTARKRMMLPPISAYEISTPLTQLPSSNCNTSTYMDNRHDHYRIGSPKITEMRHCSPISGIRLAPLPHQNKRNFHMRHMSQFYAPSCSSYNNSTATPKSIDGVVFNRTPRPRVCTNWP